MMSAPRFVLALALCAAAGASPRSQTTLTWAWVRTGEPALVGTLTWPSSHSHAESHAAGLLNIAEAAFVEGCVLPDATVSAPSSDEVRLLGAADRDDVRPLIEDLERAIPKWRAPHRC